ncbi:MAG: hypothetical protein KKF33_02260 [Alphaproteobacteria bacterium]|jgi:acyl-CoA synthetase (AMP-forming)/AMP-acid ligase II|nr:hypothetical protein [Alphaproteobacteria bacterium]
MNMIKIIALTATLVAGVSAASANPYNTMGGVNSLQAIQEASGATVLSINSNEAISLARDTDVASVQALVKNNKWLVETIERQGYTVDQIVGVSGEQNSLTLYAL